MTFVVLCKSKLFLYTSGCAVYDMGLRQLAYWGCGFESRRLHGCLSVVSVVCCQAEVSASG